MLSKWRLTIFSVGRYLSSALCQHCRPLDTRSQYHGLGLGHHFLFFLAKNAGEHLPLSWSGPSVGPDGYTQLHLLYGTARGINITQIAELLNCPECVLLLSDVQNDVKNIYYIEYIKY